jgi:peptide/nickel transport system permease protein
MKTLLQQLRSAVGSRLSRLLLTAAALLVFGSGAVVLTFFLVGLVREKDGFRHSGTTVPGTAPTQQVAEAPQAVPTQERFEKWVGTLLRSGFTEWGESATVPSVKTRLKSGLPVTATLALSSWLLSFFFLGPTIALVLIALRRGERTLREVVYPGWQALPSLPLILLVFIVLSYAFPVHEIEGLKKPGPEQAIRFVAAVATLVALITPSAATIWLNALSRVYDWEFIRVLRTTGIAPSRLLLRHVLPNALVTSGLLTQAAFKLPLLMVGSIYLEKLMDLEGVSADFIIAVTSGQCELAAAATVVFFVPLAAGVMLAEAIVVYLDPKQQGEQYGRF